MNNDFSKPLYSVIIPHKNDAERLRRCLDALVNATENTALLKETEILVVDNNSDTDLSELRGDFPSVRFTTELEPGAAMARNRGVRETVADRIFFLDCDCIPATSWLDASAKAIEGTEIVGGRVDTFDELPPPRTGAQAFETIFAFRQKFYIEERKFSVTANLLTWRTIFEDVGDFYAHVSEDLEWCQRAGKKGYKLTYSDKVKVSHPTRSDWNALSRKWKRLVSESFALHQMNGGTRAAWFLRANAVMVSPLLDFLKVLKSSKLNSLRERSGAAATLFRIRWLRAWWMTRQYLGFDL